MRWLTGNSLLRAVPNWENMLDASLASGFSSYTWPLLRPYFGLTRALSDRQEFHNILSINTLRFTTRHMSIAHTERKPCTPRWDSPV